jgi:hypothetical protein
MARSTLTALSRLNRLAGLLTVACGLTVGFSGGAVPQAHASDQIGVYAKIGKVIVNGSQVTICGAFRVANTAGDYQPAATGYLFYECKGDSKTQTMCQMQWTEIANGVTGKNCVGWGNRHGTYGEDTKNTQVRTTLPAQGPNPYPLEMGVVQMPSSASTLICDSLTGLPINHSACDGPALLDMAGSPADMTSAPAADLSTPGTTPPGSAPKSGCSAAPGALPAGGATGLLLGLGALMRLLQRRRQARS